MDLIDKQDNFEVIRDQIAAILVTETANQMALATAAGRDPTLWDLRVYLERSAPFEQFLNDPETDSGVPIVNIWVDGSQYNKSASNVMARQKSETVYNIDCYGLGVSADNPAGGHIPGDEQASYETQRATRLVRNILMAAENTYLQARGLVWLRWFNSTEFFQPQIDGRTVQNVKGARAAFQVDFNEFSPQGDETNILELLTTAISRAEDGQIILNADYQYPL